MYSQKKIMALVFFVLLYTYIILQFTETCSNNHLKYIHITDEKRMLSFKIKCLIML